MNTRSCRHVSRNAVTRIEVAVGLVVVCLAAWFIVPAIGRSRAQAYREACLSNLHEIGQALDHYLKANDDRWPYVAKLRSFRLAEQRWPTLPKILKPYLDHEGDAFHCPADSRELSDGDTLLKEFPRKTTWYATEGLSYEWWLGTIYGGSKVGEEPLENSRGVRQDRADQHLLSDFEPFHQGDGGGRFNTLFADFRARTTRADKNR